METYAAPRRDISGLKMGNRKGALMRGSHNKGNKACGGGRGGGDIAWRYKEIRLVRPV